MYRAKLYALTKLIKIYTTMDKFTDKVCDLIVKCARIINAVLPAILGIIVAYLFVMIGYVIFNL